MKMSHAMLTFEQKKRMDTTLALSEYELERGKPVPSKNHAIVQSNLLFSIRQYFGNLYQVLPDLMSIYVFYALNDYDVFVKKDILTDKKLHIQLDLSEIFI